MKYLNYGKVGFFLSLIIFCVGCCSKKIAPKYAADYNNTSVFLVIKSVEAKIPVEIEDTGGDENVPISVSTGTGASISSNPNYSDILTAGHVCAEFDVPEVLAQSIQTNFYLLDIAGNNYSADLVAIDHESDLCLLRIYTPTKPAKVSEKKLKSGDKVFYSGYPLGIYNPGSLHHFSGYFSGTDPNGYSMYSLPAAPGASGSPIFDEDDKLVGIISAIPEEFSHLSIGAGTQRIKTFLFLSADCKKFCVNQ